MATNPKPQSAWKIASPSDTHPVLAEKCMLYLRAGVQLIWVLWPSTRSIDIWQPSSLDHPITTLKGDDCLDGLDVIPGFQCPLAGIFED